MKKVYAQVNINGSAIDVNVQNAIDGFENLNYDVVTFSLLDVLAGRMDYRFN